MIVPVLAMVGVFAVCNTMGALLFWNQTRTSVRVEQRCDETGAHYILRVIYRANRWVLVQAGDKLEWLVSTPRRRDSDA